MLVPREHSHLLHGSIGEVLLDIRQSGHSLALDQRLAIRQSRVAEDGHAMTQGYGDLASQVELHESSVELRC